MKGRGVDIREDRAKVGAGVAQLGQRRWDEVPVRNGSQVRILPPALFASHSNATQDENRTPSLMMRRFESCLLHSTPTRKQRYAHLVNRG